MPQSFASVHLHIVFSTKHRAPLILPDLAERLYSYFGGICRHERSPLIAAGGMPDHIHLLVSLSREVSVAALVRTLKAGSSRMFHDAGRHEFDWQKGYGVVAVSFSNLDRVKQYIANQAKHHRKLSYQDEFRELLRKHNIAFDERYLWE
jgi:REP element-mobilizing transposase RayT